MGLETPLSMPTSEGGLHAGSTMMDLGAFQALHPPQFHQFNPFIQAPPSQPSFAPSIFVPQDTSYERMDKDGSPMDSDPSEERMSSLDSAFQSASPLVGVQSGQFGGMEIAAPPPASAEKFRFHAILKAPTAMIKLVDEIPVTYLNKGQTYTLSLVDTNATIPVAPGTRYRTYIRISFEDDQQRHKPGVCWSLWKEGRGTNEAHQGGGNLQAVEFIESSPPAEGDDEQTRIELESASFDGFCVLWTPGIHAPPGCNISVRFNFLSTDFSYSKGVKGIPVRLCAKTNPSLSDPTQPAADANPEICYCKVKLFRDHGAERKLSNDVAHVKKAIDELEQQIAQAEGGMKDFGTRKTVGNSQAKAGEQRRGKVQKYKRTWPISSASSVGGRRSPLEEDLHFKLQTLQDMFTSTRHVSVLYLRGAELDDPDLHPVALTYEPTDLTKVQSGERAAWQARSGRSSATRSSLVSLSSSSPLLASQSSVIGPAGKWSGFNSLGERSSRQDQPTGVNKSDDAGSLSGWVEALSVNPSYRPPPERTVKPAACFYICRNSTAPEQREYHKAVYLMQRTLKDFNARVAAKWNIDASKILRTVHVLQKGLEVEMDDDVIQVLKEGQDMMLGITEIMPEPTVAKREWETAVDTTEADTPTSQTATPAGYELRLRF